MSLESMHSTGEHIMTKEEAGELYISLPEGMKTGHYGFAPEGQLFEHQQDAGPNALPYVVVDFTDGRKISLHMSARGEKSFEEQAQDIVSASSGAHNVAHVSLRWEAAD